jgi:hypothetical protein
MPEQNNRDPHDAKGGDHVKESGPPAERTFIHRILRYVPNLVRDEWVNIGVLLYDPNTGERRLRLIEDEAEYNRLRRIHPRLDEESLRGLRDHLESRFGAAMAYHGNGGPIRSTLRNGEGNPKADTTEWFSILEKWDATLSQSLQLADSKATIADDINTEIDRLYNERVAVGQSYTVARPNRPSARDQMRNYMDQVFRQANLWSRIEKNVHVSEYSLDKDPLRIDYSYLRNDKMRGFVQTVSLSTRLDEGKVFAYTAKKIQTTASELKVGASPEFVAVTDVGFNLDNENHAFLKEMFDKTGIEHVPLENAAVWVAKLRPMLQ